VSVSIVPVIISGGAGSRLWPLSTDVRPKQFHALAGTGSLFAQTLARSAPDIALGDGVRFGAPLVVCGVTHAALVREELARAGIAGSRLLLEPAPRNTGPALAAAAAHLAACDPEALMLVVPADHVIGRPEVLRAACLKALPPVQQGLVVTFGITPDRPETGYGYIRAGEPLGQGVHRIAAFVEKPDIATAQGYLASGDYAWNAGIFFCAARTLLAELQTHAPEVLAAATVAVARAAPDPDGDSCAAPGLVLDANAFADAPSVSIDYAVMERTGAAAVIPVDMDWNDVGSFASLWEIAPKDAAGNAASGPVLLEGASGCLVRADTVPVAVIGLDDVMVVATATGILVAPRSRAQDVRLAAAAFKPLPARGA
jgi:mannose-1-phosphate guanylyltransferase / mannose-6-phosphate isomerase